MRNLGGSSRRPTGMRPLVGVVAAALIVVGCASNDETTDPSSSRPKTDVGLTTTGQAATTAPPILVTGTVRLGGGPYPGDPMHGVPGPVQVHLATLAGPTVTAINADSSGTFRVSLAPGAYVFAYWPAEFDQPCASDPYEIGPVANVVAIDCPMA